MFAPSPASDRASALGDKLRARRARRKGITVGRILMWGVYAALITTILNLILWLSYAEWQYLNLPH